MALRNFTVPQENFSDVVLIVEGKRLHVEKQYISAYSPVFRSMFYFGFAEANKKEVALEDLKYDEFVELLNVIYPSHARIKANTVEFLLRLGDRFGIDYVLRQCVAFLGTPHAAYILVPKKLLWVDLYCFSEIDNLCKALFKKIDDVRILKSYPNELACLPDRVMLAVMRQCLKVI